MHALPASITPPHFPSLMSIYDIADYLKVSPFLFRSMLQRPFKHYRSFRFKKRNGEFRTIHSPRTFLKVTHWWILDTILNNCPISEHAHGFVRGRSFLTNANKHFGASNILNLDVKDFFPSIRVERATSQFRKLGYSDKVSEGLASLTSLNGSLPQGAPTSPALANLVMFQIDEELAKVASESGLTYTRYADDMTFSGNQRISEKLVDVVAAQIGAVGLTLNGSKARFMGPNDKKEVTGLVLGLNDVRLDREFLNRARGWFHSAICQPERYASRREHIRGTVALIEHVRGAGSAKVAELGRRALQAIEKSAVAAS